MNSSGIKRGLAVSAVAALGVVGAPGLAHAGTANTVTLSASPSSVVTYQNGVLTVTAKDAAGVAAASEAVSITLTETDPAGSATVQNADPFTTTGTNITAAFSTDDSSNGKWTETGTVTTGADGTASFKLASSVAGTVNVAAADGGATNSTNLTVTGGKSYGTPSAAGAATQSLKLSSTGSTEYVDDWTGTEASAPFSVLALDSGSQPVGGTKVQYTVTKADGTTAIAGSTLTTPSPSAASDSNPYAVAGPDLSTLKTLGAGTYTVKLWVNNSSAGTPGADSGEPAATYTVTLDANSSATQLDETGDYANGGVSAPSATSGKLPADAKDTTVPLAVKVLGADGKPVANAHVRFDVKIAKSADLGTTTAKTFAAATDANGIASVSVPVSAAQAVNGTEIQADVFLSESPNAGVGTELTANAGTPAPVVAATFETRKLTIGSVSGTNAAQATKGGSVSVPVIVTDQFGSAPSAPQQLSFQITTGPNNSASKTVLTTDNTGKATFTYTDTKAAAGNADKVTVSDLTDNTAASLVDYEIDYIAGSTAASKIEFTTDSSKVTAPTPVPSYSVSANGVNGTYQVKVTNSNGDALVGSPVTFSVNQGFVEDANKATNKGASITVYTVAGGLASVEVGSTKTGAQSLSVTAGAASASSANAVTYTPGIAYNVSYTTAPATITSGDSAKYVALVTDEFGNPVNDVAGVYFALDSNTQPGSISQQNGQVDRNGDVSAVISTLSSDEGNGTLIVHSYDDSSAPGGHSWATAKDSNATVSFSDPAPTADGVSTAYTVEKPVVVTPQPPVKPASPVIKGIGGRSAGANDVVTVHFDHSAGKRVVLVRGGKVVGRGTVKHGKVIFRVKDMNGNKATKYVAKFAGRAHGQTVTVK